MFVVLGDCGFCRFWVCCIISGYWLRGSVGLCLSVCVVILLLIWFDLLDFAFDVGLVWCCFGLDCGGCVYGVVFRLLYTALRIVSWFMVVVLQGPGALACWFDLV